MVSEGDALFEDFVDFCSIMTDNNFSMASFVSFSLKIMPVDEYSENDDFFGIAFSSSSRNSYAYRAERYRMSVVLELFFVKSKNMGSSG